LTSAAFRGVPIEAAIVDLDGTMVDTAGDFVEALGRMLRDLGLPPVPRSFVERAIGRGSERLIADILAEVGADAQLFERAFERYQHHYLQVNGMHATVYGGVEEGLALLRSRGLRLACLTNKPTALARTLLRAMGLAPHFDHVFGGDAFERKKPDPLPVLRACAALDTRPAHTLVIGDSTNDAQAARAAGAPVVLVTYGYNHGEPVRKVDADGFVERMDRLQFS
jgi:phosphoglycolate phosphatase